MCGFICRKFDTLGDFKNTDTFYCLFERKSYFNCYVWIFIILPFSGLSFRAVRIALNPLLKRVACVIYIRLLLSAVDLF